jgi:hypothetical protein
VWEGTLSSKVTVPAPILLAKCSGGEGRGGGGEEGAGGDAAGAVWRSVLLDVTWLGSKEGGGGVGWGGEVEWEVPVGSEDDAALVGAVTLLVTGNRFAKVLNIVTLYGNTPRY